jgi:hypothetical protein
MQDVDTPESREEEVKRYQVMMGMQPRIDSRLTYQYSRKMRPDFRSPREVANELVSTNFIYENTIYGEVIESFLRKVAKRIKTEDPSTSWTDVWKIVPFYGSIALKLMLVSACLIRIPDHPKEF